MLYVLYVVSAVQSGHLRAEAAPCLSTPRDVLRELSGPEKVDFALLRFTERLGKGEFGEVFRGYYREEEVAIKQLFFDENMTELVLQEATTLLDITRVIFIR